MAMSMPLHAVTYFRGYVDGVRNRFISDEILFELPQHITAGHTLFINPRHLVISRERLPSSMRNHYAGVIVAMNAIGEEIHIQLQAAAVLHVIITPKSSQEMGLQPGQAVWASCKSSDLTVI